MTDPVRPRSVAELDAGPIEFRLDRRGTETVVIFHGGHMHAGLAVGESVFAEAGWSVLAVSRPGYGHVPFSSHTSPEQFVDRVRSLCDYLGIVRVRAAVGISAGGPTALALASRHPDLVERVVLQSSVGPVPWPGPRTRAVAKVAFAPRAEKLTWGAVRLLMRTVPGIGLPSMLGDLSTSSGRRVAALLTQEERDGLIGLFCGMRSGPGFSSDLQALRQGMSWRPEQPVLIVHSRRDGSVPFCHAETLHTELPNSRLFETSAEHHLIWFSDDWARIAKEIRAFCG